ncbi:MAG: EAL domain-containing protein [Longicatena sp.]
MYSTIYTEDEAVKIYNMLSPNKYSLLSITIKNIQFQTYRYSHQKVQSFFQLISKQCAASLHKDENALILYSNTIILLWKSQSTKIISKRIYELENTISTLCSSSIPLSIGICFLNLAQDIHQAINYANHASSSSLDYSKYTTSFEFYHPSFAESIQHHFYIENLLYEAFASNEFQIYLQPKVSISTNKVVGAEALIRWIHKGKEIPIKDFMPLLNKNSFIRNIDLFVFESVCKYLISCQSKNIPLLCISINISASSFQDSAYFLQQIQSIHSTYPIPKKFLEFELSEDIAFQNNQRLLTFISDLTTLGYTTSLDDFGSGYSSLHTLSFLKVSTIKLDYSFFSSPFNERSKLILLHILSLLKALDYKIIAEGVETLEQLDFLKDSPCDAVQGFYFSKPLPIPSFIKYYKEINK